MNDQKVDVDIDNDANESNVLKVNPKFMTK